MLSFAESFQKVFLVSTTTFALAGDAATALSRSTVAACDIVINNDDNNTDFNNLTSDSPKLLLHKEPPTKVGDIYNIHLN